MTPVLAGIDSGSQAALEHGETGFHLRPLAVLAVVFAQALFHPPTIASGGQLGAGSTSRGRNEGADAVPLARMTMVGLGVEPSIGQDSIDADFLQGCVE